MQANTSIQLPLEQALKALIPYLQTLEDTDGIWNFLGVFPDTFLYLAGHEARNVPETTPAYLGFVSTLANQRIISPRHPVVTVKMELITAQIADPDLRSVAIIDHSLRSSALLKLFSPLYLGTLLKIVNPPSSGPDTRPWQGLGFSYWKALPPESGQSPNGTAFVSSPSYIFCVHLETDDTDSSSS